MRSTYTTTTPRLLACASGIVAAVALGALSAQADDAAKDKLAKDREAILGMAGEFAVEFNFWETFALQEEEDLDKPYKSDANEIVVVVVDEPKHIVLQHLLVVGDHVVKHWSQEWQYEDEVIYEYQGNDTWKPTLLGKAERKGTWSQAVGQIDDSPRYEGYGKWTHQDGVSTWEAEPTYRPLPRRELKRGKTYDLIEGRNRHTLTPTGWVHEQDNTKIELTDNGPSPLVREVGLNRYIRVSDFDFGPAKEYWSRNKDYWEGVRGAWKNVYSRRVPVKILEVDGKLLREPVYELLEELPEETRNDPEAVEKKVGEIFDTYLASEEE